MIIAKPPIRPLSERRLSTGGGVYVMATRYPKGTRLEPHRHRESQLVFATEGTMQVTTPKGRWLVPPDRAVWMPAGLPHAIDVLADIEMRSLYFDVGWMKRDDAHRANLDAEFVVRVSQLLHQAILALFDGRNDPGRSALLIRLALLELHPAEDPATFIPLPHEPRCRRAADIVLADPTATYEIEALARSVGTSARTLSRLFLAETQLSFRSWCLRARMAAAVARLSMDRNAPMKQLAADLGYASLSAFSHAFRQITGKTPTEFADKA
jgi:AraC-like DNA-binding protein/quercetin dioxygenase-like cupin family protein